MAKVSEKVAGRRALPLAVSVLLKRQSLGLGLWEWLEESNLIVKFLTLKMGD